MKPIMARKKCLQALKNEDSDPATQTKNPDLCYYMVSEETDVSICMDARIFFGITW